MSLFFFVCRVCRFALGGFGPMLLLMQCSPSNLLRDMFDSIDLSSCIAGSFLWPLPPVTRTPERKSFDIACAKWDEHQAQERAKRRPSRSPAVRQRAYSSAASAPVIAHSTVRHTGHRASTGAVLRRSTSIDRGHGKMAEPPSNDAEVKLKSPPQRLSRVIRVFCAWKPS